MKLPDILRKGLPRVIPEPSGRNMSRSIQFLLGLRAIFFQYQRAELVLNAFSIVLVIYVTIAEGN
ncbi:hypothetical protein N8T08_009671 [Aspergillus melleus]|uniref:Uncharacterized protein n=1 Tax=Aspergillus melleus TaxID=138277 RepID=A0ACC3ATB4_9EURO|nr:hypothetical protein N8T08_009671 [Aspergillus melleus]